MTHRRLALLPLLLCLWTTASDGQGLAVRFTSELAHSEIVVRGPGGRLGGAAPLIASSLDPGLYRIDVYREGTVLASGRLEVGSTLRMRGGRGSAALLSGVFPGLGAWRDHGPRSALLPMTSVGLAIGRGLYFDSQRSRAESELAEWVDSRALLLEGASPEEIARYEAQVAKLSDDVWIEQQTRNDYLTLAAVLHAGQILQAGVRRGPYRLDLSSANSVAARWRPPSRSTVVGLSALWPGLGQIRAGHELRGRLWHVASTVVGITLVQAQRSVDRNRGSLNSHDREVALLEGGDPALLAQAIVGRSGASADLASAEDKRDAVLLGAAALWLLNLADAWLAGSPQPVPLATGRVAEASSRFDVALGAPQGAGFGLRMRF